MQFSDNELEALLVDLESDLVERKRSAADGTKLRRTVTAFANDLAGRRIPGVVFVGVEDDGRCSGVPVTDDLLTTLAQIHGDGSVMPLPSITVQKRKLLGCEMAVVIVEPSPDPPVRYEGRVWVKVGPTVQQASAAEERTLLERRRAGDTTFDRRAASGTALEDLDLDFVRREFLPRAIAQDVLESNNRPFEQQLQSLRLSVGGVPTHAALLAFGRDPQRWLPGAYVQFLRIDGSELTDPIRDQKVLTGRLDEVLGRLDDLIDINIATRTDVVSQPVEVRQPDYPAVALQQLTRNAVMHRAYDGTNAPVRVHWYTDRVEVLSPGGLYGEVTPVNFGSGVTDYRNPLVAEIMHHLGFAQRFGLGVPLARKALSGNGNPPPEFTFTTSTLAVVRAAR